MYTAYDTYTNHEKYKFINQKSLVNSDFNVRYNIYTIQDYVG